ncbi:MAG TPA: hypothetical protein VGT05_00490 [Patescibacteria group bacterium]|nr:hypothetical protein [Patescibacteria group bacterium]
MSLYASLIQHEFIHLFLTFIAIAVTLLLFLHKKSNRQHIYIMGAVIGAFIGEFFLDADHLFDYILVFGMQFRPDYFFSGKMFTVSHKVYVPFHSWELAIVLFLLLYSIKSTTIRCFLTSLLIGLLLHLAYDTYFNHMLLLGYSFIYRMLHHFDARYFSTESS